MKEALKLALESMKRIDAWLIQRGYTGLMPQEKEVITSIESALAQQEPVATVESVATVVSESGNQEVTMSWWHEPALPVGTKLYTTPPASVTEAPQEQQSCDRRTWGKPWVSLTDDEIWKFWCSRPEVSEGEDDSMEAEFVTAVRAVLAAHGIKEKNT